MKIHIYKLQTTHHIIIDLEILREQATGEQARQPVFGQAVNRLFAQQATEEQTTGEHEKDKCQEGASI